MLTQARAKFYELLSEINHLDGIRALLDWDQQVMLPPAATRSRASQLEVLSVIRHQKLLNPALYQAAKTIEQSCDKFSDDFINAQWIIKSSDRERRLPEEFVAKRARLQTECFQVWQQAKNKSRFDIVEGTFIELLEVYKQETNFVGYQEHPYDALLDQYEPEGKVSWVMPLLKQLGNNLKPIIASRLEDSNSYAGRKKFPLDQQKQFQLGEKIVRSFGLPSDCNRLDASSHPFCTTIGVNDVRITTRYDESNLLSALSSTMHELGHALYEYNQDPALRGTACAEIHSLGLHESQSRFVENCIGRSRQFCEYLSRVINDDFGINYAASDLYEASNEVKRTLIRVDADEVTYSLHVLIRFELEIELLTGALLIKDLPECWNQKYKDYLGLSPINNRDGVLQDVHWYSGAFGYFPTYVLGNIYKGSMLKQMQKDIPDMWSQVQNGNFAPTIEWLKINVHRKGSRMTPRQLVSEFAKSSQLSADDFLDYLKSK